MPSELQSFPSPFSAVVIGAAGGIGGALVEALAGMSVVSDILAVARKPIEGRGKVRVAVADVTDEKSLAAAAAQAGPEPRLVIVASGALHGPFLPGAPEKQLRDLSPDTLARTFAINAVGPALAIKHFSPLLPRGGKSVIAALSAKVGSIGDNRLGGWYGYRASKAALNMFVKTAAIEIGQRRKDAVVLALHPGTVDTPFSKPFQGSADRVLAPADSAAHLLTVIDTTTPSDSGAFLSWNGAPLPY